ncbi:MAG: hypothetical protein OEZ68_18640 [Gammaproteobacteria bacterium]|nr:hypothetical protein [Gammaproteobacteria bacterium]MDH5802825.1 hypothetical protein [Gammaproteobacteria bacterium]
MKQCGENFQVDLVPLAFDLTSQAGSTALNNLKNIDFHINSVLESNTFQESLKKAVRDYQSKAFFGSLKGKSLSPQEQEEAMLEALLKAAKKTGGAELKNSIMQSPDAQRLKTDLQEFKSAFECSPTGVWVDKNKGLLIVVGVLGAIGGSYYMYKNRTGDTIADLSKSLLKKTWVVGSINLDTKVTKLVPSKREIGVELAASYKWEQITTKVSINMLAHEKLADISTMGTITIPLKNRMVAGIGIGSSNTNLPLGAGSTGVQDSSLNAFVNLQYNRDNLSIQLNASTDDKGTRAIGAILHLEF